MKRVNDCCKACKGRHKVEKLSSRENVCQIDKTPDDPELVEAAWRGWCG